mgnify:CR=1
GRYLNDGSFGITGQCKDISAEEVDLLENHKFEEIRTLFWRNSNLNFNNPFALIKSLDVLGFRPRLELRMAFSTSGIKLLSHGEITN